MEDLKKPFIAAAIILVIIFGVGWFALTYAGPCEKQGNLPVWARPSRCEGMPTLEQQKAVNDAMNIIGFPKP